MEGEAVSPEGIHEEPTNLADAQKIRKQLAKDA